MIPVKHLVMSGLGRTYSDVQLWQINSSQLTFYVAAGLYDPLVLLGLCNR